ncbi:MAG: 2-oxo acid dehydrogenase subunit E2 [Armatimonadota bacterium]
MSRRPDDQEFEQIEHTRIRRAIGERTLKSVNEIPQFRVQKQAIADGLVEFRSRLKEAGGDIIPTYNDIIIKLVAAVLPDHPRLNAWCADEGLKLLENINVGFAVDTDDGVMLPTVFNADEKPLEEIARDTADMIDKARRGRLRASLQMGAGFTISNIGPIGIDVFDAIISPPQTAILALGSIMEKPVAIKGRVVTANTVWLSLTMDHKSVDGADGARFLADLAEHFENPEAVLGD